jgi:hypothetical protein
VVPEWLAELLFALVIHECCSVDYGGKISEFLHAVYPGGLAELLFALVVHECCSVD